jgi:hypothetical protein
MAVSGWFLVTRVMPQKLLDLFMYLVIVELADVRTDNLIREGQRVLSAQMGCLRINKYCPRTGVIREYIYVHMVVSSGERGSRLPGVVWGQ